MKITHSDFKAYAAWKECVRKTKYKHEGQAKREAHRSKQRAYKCTQCDGYHITKK